MCADRFYYLLLVNKQMEYIIHVHACNYVRISNFEKVTKHEFHIMSKHKRHRKFCMAEHEYYVMLWQLGKIYRTH